MEIHLTDSDLNRVIAGLKSQHRELGKKIENSERAGNFRSFQRRRKAIRNMAVEKFDLDRENVNDWK